MGFKSLFAQVEDADPENNSTLIYMKGLAACTVGLGIPVATTVIGAIFIGDCPLLDE